MSTEPFEIESIQRLNVKPGELLVLTVPPHTTKADVDAIKTMMEARAPEGVSVLVATKDITLQVVAKPRELPMRRNAYTEHQWAELLSWLHTLGLQEQETGGITLTDTEVTVTHFKLNADGKRYAVEDQVATTYLTVPLSDAPEWFTDLAA